MSEELILRHCSPTLAGMKTGNLFTCTCSDEEELKNDIRSLNKTLVPKGIRVLYLRKKDSTALVYIYRPVMLKNDLEHNISKKLLAQKGYPYENADYCVARLVKQLNMNDDFPHEIGLFLGYPPEDVKGFIENKAENSKMNGYWKVYGDEDKAISFFDKYKKCTEVYIKQWLNGKSVERLTRVMK